MLKPILIANAISCLGFGAAFALAPGPISTFIGEAPRWSVLVLGAGLILNGFHLLWVSSKPNPRRGEIGHFIVGDIAWVVATAVLISSGIWITAPAAITWAICIAIWVGLCGLFQAIYIPKRSDPATG